MERIGTLSAAPPRRPNGAGGRTVRWRFDLGLGWGGESRAGLFHRPAISCHAHRVERDRARIGVALSGGGHRASLFAAGALLGLVDASLQTRLVSISSVSGGSITNGIVAASGDLQGMDRAALEAALRPGIEVFARQGLFFPGQVTDRYVQVTLALCAAAAGAAAAVVIHGVRWVAVAAAVLAVAVIGRLVATRAVPVLTGAGVLAGCVAGGALVAAVPLFLSSAWATLAGQVALTLALAGAAVAVLGRRALVVDNALHAGLLRQMSLSGADRPVHHVFCASDMSAGRFCFLTPRVVYGYTLGAGTPNPALRLSTAVQASACFPGGFPPRRLTAADLTAAPLRQASVDLTDGGVYDNMADEWEFGWPDRLTRYPHLAAIQPAAAGTLIVVNAGKPWTAVSLPRRGLRREVRSLLAAADIQGAITTRLRRRYLVELFLHPRDSDPTGCLIHIEQTLTGPAQQRLNDPDPAVAARAGQVLDLIGRLTPDDPAYGETLPARNTRVPTVLRALGAQTATDLMHHAYLLTRLNLYLHLGEGTLPGPDDPLDDWTRDRFTQLAGPPDITPGTPA